MSMKRSCRLLWLCLVAAAAICAGCASSSPEETSGSEEISQLPWSRPQSWEGQGMLGGMMPNQR